MVVAGLLTLVALCGIATGVWAGRSGETSGHLSAAGGGLLFGIAVFWLMPEMAGSIGWLLTMLSAFGAGAVLSGIHRFFMYQEVAADFRLIGPLLAATAVHSFLDGWSVRALGEGKLQNFAVSLGLGLHKFPEGIALGWITRRTALSTSVAVIACGAVELLTIFGAAVQPTADRGGTAKFGVGWIAGVLAIISGSFLFLGVHAILPNRKRGSILAVFLSSTIFVGCLGVFRH
jgi:zinc transporter ZupT